MSRLPVCIGKNCYRLLLQLCNRQYDGGSAMNITDIKIRKIFTEGKVRAVVSIILDGDFAVHDLKVIEGVERLFVAMPNRRSEDGRFQDIVHPISTEARTQLETVVLEKYKEAVEAAEAAEPVEPAETENSND